MTKITNHRISLLLCILMLFSNVYGEGVVNVRKVDIVNKGLYDFLDNTLTPFILKNGYDKTKDRLFIYLDRKKGNSEFTELMVSLYLDENSIHMADKTEIDKLYGFEISNIPILIVCDELPDFTTRAKGYVKVPWHKPSIEELLLLDGAYAEWYFDADSNSIYFNGFFNNYIKWFNDTPKEDYMPVFNTIKKIESGIQSLNSFLNTGVQKASRMNVK